MGFEKLTFGNRELYFQTYLLKKKYPRVSRAFGKFVFGIKPEGMEAYFIPSGLYRRPRSLTESTADCGSRA